MKVVKRGTIPAERFIGARDTCDGCGTRVAFDKADAARVEEVYDPREGVFLVLPWNCPHCGASNRHWKTTGATIRGGD